MIFYLQALVVSIVAVSAQINDTNCTALEGQKDGDGVVIVYGSDFWNVRFSHSGDAGRILTNNIDYHIDVVNGTVVVYTAWMERKLGNKYAKEIIIFALRTGRYLYANFCLQYEKCDYGNYIFRELKISSLGTDNLSFECLLLHPSHLSSYYNIAPNVCSPEIFKYSIVGSGESLLHTLTVFTWPTSPFLTFSLTVLYSWSKRLK